MKKLSIQTLMQTSCVGFGTSGARGLVKDMTDRLCYAYTKAFLQEVISHAGPILLGHDLRPSSPAIAAACAAAMRDMGYSVIYAGALPTPALAYFASTIKSPCIVVTGSHIPFDRNGLKFYRADGEITKADEDLMRAAVVDVPDEIYPFNLENVDQSASNSYVNRYVEFFGRSSLAGMRIVIFEHSSVSRDILHEILIGLGAEVLPLGRTDTFVPIDTEAVGQEDIAQAQTWAEMHQFDAILSTDGDGDRPLIGDENGQWFRGDIVGILCAMYLKADTVVTPVSSNTAVELCGTFKNVVRTKIGSPYVIAGMEQASRQSIVVGYEANGGFLLGSDVTRNSQTLKALPTRDAVLPMLALLCMAREQGVALSKLSQNLPMRFTASDRLQNFPHEKSKAILNQLSSNLSITVKVLSSDTGEIVDVNLTDGLRLTFANGDIFHLRPSGNAPELRCYAEAATEAKAKLLCESTLKLIDSI
ncbi:{ManB} Phosphomannomutase [Methylophilaceae bacterium]